LRAFLVSQFWLNWCLAKTRAFPPAPREETPIAAEESAPRESREKENDAITKFEDSLHVPDVIDKGAERDDEIRICSAGGTHGHRGTNVKWPMPATGRVQHALGK